MKTELLFPTPIWVEDNCDIELDPIAEFAYKVREEDTEGRRSSNAGGGWQSHDFRPDWIPNTPLKPVHDRIMLMAYGCADDFGFNDYRLSMSNMWININGRGAYNHMHIHGGSMFSGVFYVKVPSCCCGELKFLRPLEYQAMKEYWGCNENFDRYDKDYNNLDHFIPPENNKLVMFPSWMQHSVDANASDHDRISISFNIFIFSEHYINEVYPKGEFVNPLLS